MGFFPATIASRLAGSRITKSALVQADFLSNTRRLWTGFGTLKTNDGNEWEGIGAYGSFSGLESAINGAAPLVTFTLSGVDPSLTSKALNASSEVKGRSIKIFVQYFNDDDPNHAVPLDNPYALYLGRMDVMRIKMTGVSTRVIELDSETVYSRRSVPPFGNLSDRDQHRLFPNDRGLEFIASMASKTVEWPKAG